MNTRKRPNAWKCEHTDRLHRAFGLCEACYARERYRSKTGAKPRERRRKAECHPGRDAKGHGLCASCYRRKWKEENAALVAERSAQWHQRNKARRSAAERARRVASYGLTPEALESVVAKQGGKCAVCADVFRSVGSMQIDHCHETGLFRGVLCKRCNMALGLFKDNVASLYMAAGYLLKHRAETKEKTNVYDAAFTARVAQ